MIDSPRAIVLLICDDHRTLTDALAMVVEQDPELRMPAPPVSDPQEAIDLVRKFHPDVILMDVMFKGPMTGIDATTRIKKVSPKTKVVIMTAHEDDRTLVEAVEAGASGFLGKSEAVDKLLSSVKAAADGEVLIDPTTLTRILQQVNKQRQAQREALVRLAELTDREREVLQLLAQGERNDGVSEALGIKVQTVQTHVRNILGKLDVHSKLEAVAFAVRNGAISV